MAKCPTPSPLPSRKSQVEPWELFRPVDSRKRLSRLCQSFQRAGREKSPTSPHPWPYITRSSSAPYGDTELVSFTSWVIA
jgi:hypothetical protein